MKNFLGRGSGLAAVIQAVVDGNLAPVGYTNGFRGITGYLFAVEDLRKYRPMPDSAPHMEGFLNFREAAALLGVKSVIVRGLVEGGGSPLPPVIRTVTPNKYQLRMSGASPPSTSARWPSRDGSTSTWKL
jgi:hypothetical protein